MKPASSVPEQAPPTSILHHAPPTTSTVDGGEGPTGVAAMATDVDETKPEGEIIKLTHTNYHVTKMLIYSEDKLILPEKKKKSRSTTVALPALNVDEVPSGEEAPKATLTAAPSWAEFDLPKKKKKLREVS